MITQNSLVIPGQLHSLNKMTMDWGPNKLIAYSSWNYIIIIDPKSMRRIHTLDKHTKIITKLKWASHDLIPSSLYDYNLTLASGDECGVILIWNVNEGIVQVELKDENFKSGKVIDLIWHPYHRNLLYALYSLNNNTTMLALWDISSSKMNWKYIFNTDIVSLSLNPFDHTQMCAFNSIGHIYFLKDLKEDTQPHRVVLKYKISSSSPTVNDENIESFNQMIYSPYTRNIAYFLLDFRILIFDLSLNQSIGSIIIDTKKSPFTQLLVSKNDNRVIFSLHEDGTLSSWVRRDSLNISYSLKTTIDVLKVTKRKRDPNVIIQNAVLSDHDNEFNIILLSNDGCLWKVLFEQLRDINGSIIDEKFCIIGQLESISGQISSFSPFHGNSKGNDNEMVNLLAVGLKDGRIMIFDVYKQEMIRCFKSNQNLQIRGIRWIHSDKIIYFSVQTVERGMYRSRIVQLNILTGQENEIRKKKEVESTFIKGLRLSPSKTYLIILFKNFIIQLWDIKSGILIKTLQIKAVAVEWALMTKQQESTTKEHFAIATSNGMIHFYCVDNGIIQESQNSIDAGMGIDEITCISWKNNSLLVGNTANVIQHFNLELKKLYMIECKETIRRLIFSPNDNNNHVIALFKDGDFGVLDINQRQLIISNFKSRDLRTIGLDWLNGSMIVIACNDGSFRVIDKSFSSFNYSFSNPILLSYPFYSPLVLKPVKSLYLKSLLLHKDIKEESEFYSMIDQSVLNQIKSKEKIIDIALIVSNYFGFTKESRFWMLTAKSLNDYPFINESDKTIEIDPFVQDQQIGGDNNLKSKNDETNLNDVKENINELNIKDDIKLPNYFDLLMDPNQLKDTYRERSFINSNENIIDEKKIQKMVDFNLQLGEKEKAIELLLETDHNHPKYIINMLKACIIASMISKEASQNTLKRVAASFIASGNVSDGVQLLVLAGKGLDACRYLQSFDKWSQSALLAKLTLNYKEYKVVYDRWAEFLLSSGNNDNAIEILASLGEYMKVIKILYESKYYETAVIFIKALKEKNIMNDELENNKELIKNIYREYGKLLNEIGYRDKSDYYIKEGENDNNNNNNIDLIIL